MYATVTGKRKAGTAFGEGLEAEAVRICDLIQSGGTPSREERETLLAVGKALGVHRFDLLRPVDLCQILRKRIALKKQREPEGRSNIGSSRYAEAPTFGALPGELTTFFLREPGVNIRSLAQTGNPPLYNFIKSTVTNARSECEDIATEAGTPLSLQCLGAQPKPPCVLTCRAASQHNRLKYETKIITDCLTTAWNGAGDSISVYSPDVSNSYSGARLSFVLNLRYAAISLRFGSTQVVHLNATLDQPIAFEVHTVPHESSGTFYDLPSAVSYALTLSGGIPLQSIGFGGDLLLGTRSAVDAISGLRFMTQVCDEGLFVVTDNGLAVTVEPRSGAGAISATVNSETQDGRIIPSRVEGAIYIWNRGTDNAAKLQKATDALGLFLAAGAGRLAEHGATVTARPMELRLQVVK